MSAATPQQNSVALAKAAELAAQTSSLMNARAQRYADLAGGLERVLRRGRVQRNSAWSRGDVTREHALASPSL
jgi:hypothetical protein